jgi:hypothetical protein
MPVATILPQNRPTPLRLGGFALVGTTLDRTIFAS